MRHDIGFLERLGAAVEETARTEAERAEGEQGRVRRLRALRGGRPGRRWPAACALALVVAAGGIALAGMPLGWYASGGPLAVVIGNAKLDAASLQKTLLRMKAPALRGFGLSHSSPTTQIGQLTLDSSGSAWIAGQDADRTALVAFWQDGAWQRLQSPPGGSDVVGPLAADDVWASGATGLSHWDGATWKDWPLPGKLVEAAGNDMAWVNKFLAVRPDNVWALGQRPGLVYHDIADGPGENSVGYAPLTLHWDGTTWSNVVVPKLPGRSASLRGIAAGGAEVWAVGGLRKLVGIHGSGGAAASITKAEPVVFRLREGSWQRVPFPQLGAGGTDLLDVAVLDADDVWVLGMAHMSEEYTPSRDYPLLLHWDGRAWQQITGPQTDPMPYWNPCGMTVGGDSDVWLIGFDGQAETQVRHWDGSVWSSSALPAAEVMGKARTGSGIPMIAAAGSDSIWASAGVTVLPDDPLLWHWDGHQWNKIQVAIP